MREDRIPFSHILPVVDLALLVLLVFVPITYDRRPSLRGVEWLRPRSTSTAGQFEMTLSRSQIVPLGYPDGDHGESSLDDGHQPSRHTSSRRSISLPSIKSGAQSWHPQALTLQTWQALVFPFLACPSGGSSVCGLDGRH